MKLTPILLAAICLAGCNVTPAGPLQHESRSVPKDSFTSLNANLSMGSGTLKISGGSHDLLNADFDYNVAEWKPDLQYSASGDHGSLTLKQPESRGSHSHTTNVWDLRLNNDIATNLNIQFGAGEAKMDLGALALRSLDIQMGAGEMKLDLRGTPAHDYDVHIQGGAGEATVYVPKNAGIYAKAVGAIGEVKVHGLRQDGDHWVSEQYGQAGTPQIRLDIAGGVGQLNLSAE
ncbi:MAG TPA: toast rack family protein [Bryobacteraceae bacterium]|jgi:hypothetical protein|nr:toast rack family protein [Bryobacteraceae bacterium]